MHDLLVTNCKLINEGNIIECDILISKQRIEQIRPDKSGWSPFEGHEFQSSVTHTIVSGHLAYNNGVFDESEKGQRLMFSR